MAEDTPFTPQLQTDRQDDVLGKIDQLLNRHRPRPAVAEAIPMLTDGPRNLDVPIEDGIPVLTDVVTGPGHPIPASPAPSRPSKISSALILRRMAVALDAEHARLLVQIDGDAMQIRLLDRLVAELKRALPAAVRAAVTDAAPAPAQRDDGGQL